MASREHSCTRRDLLAGAVGGGAAALPSPSHRLRRRVPPSRLQGEGLEQEWEAALAALRRAEAEIAAFKRVEKALRGEGGLAASDGLGSADPPAGHCAESTCCSGDADAPASLLGPACSFAAQCDMDEAFSDLACAQNAALERLLLVPAPDLAALAAKLARVVEELAWELPQSDATMAQLAADAERLAAG